MTLHWGVRDGDALERLREMPNASVHCCVTSPPYFGLRDYGHADQIGLESTPAEYVAKLVDVFREVRRVLRPEGTLWLNLGDSFARDCAKGQHRAGQSGKQNYVAENGGRSTALTNMGDFKPKDLLMIPARVALALQADGWWLRSDIVWAKRNPMPESVTDRPTKAHEYIFLLAKGDSYFFDQEAVREPHARLRDEVNGGSWRHGRGDIQRIAERGAAGTHSGPYPLPNPGGRNIRTVWDLANEPWYEAHFATFPTEIPRRAIKAGTSEIGACIHCGAPWERHVERTDEPDASAKGSRFDAGKTAVNGCGRVQSGVRTLKRSAGWSPTCQCFPPDTGPCVVLDPFTGSGTTGAVAVELSRSFIGIELNPEYAVMARRRIQKAHESVDATAGPLFASPITTQESLW